MKSARKEEVVEEALRQLHQISGCVQEENLLSDKKDNDRIVMIGDRKFDILGAKLFNLVSSTTSSFLALVPSSSLPTITSKYCSISKCCRIFVTKTVGLLQNRHDR